jgi:Ni,Fe-hydrogenase I small subunit
VLFQIRWCPCQATSLLNAERPTVCDIVIGDTLNRYATLTVDKGNVVLDGARATVVKRQ